ALDARVAVSPVAVSDADAEMERIFDIGDLDFQPVVESTPSAHEREAVVDTTAAAEIAMVATELDLDALGVIPAQREQLQRTLLALSMSIERGAVEWNELQSAVTLVMEHPPLARRL